MRYLIRILLLIVTGVPVLLGATFNQTNDASWPVGIAAGDTLALYGTMTNTLAIGASGAAGNPITIRLMDGARFSKTNWGTTTAAAIYDDSRSYLVIDGGGTGIIENTANGEGRAASNSTTGIHLQGRASDIEIKGFIISNLVYRRLGSYDQGSGIGINIDLSDAANVLIHNNTTESIGNTIYALYRGNCTNWQIYSNTIIGCSLGIFTSSSLPGEMRGMKIWANRIDHADWWSGTFAGGGWNHNDFIKFNATINGATNYNLQIYRNHLGPNIGTHMTALISGYPDKTNAFPNLWVYNNLLEIGHSSGVDNGAFHGNNQPGILWANNTIYSYRDGDDPLGAGGFNVAAGALIYNNLLYHCTSGIIENDNIPAHIGDSDYNIWNNVYYFKIHGGQGSGNSYAEWRSLTGFDTHSSTEAPILTSSFSPAPNDTRATGKGTNLSVYFNTDFYGYQRPVWPTNWTIGAFEVPSKRGPFMSPGLMLFGLSEDRITNGQSATLSWSFGSATNVIISGIGAVAAKGSQAVSPTSTVTYTATFMDAGRLKSFSKVLNVAPK